MAQGEIISTTMMVNHLQETGVKAILLPALDFMRTDKNGEPARGSYPRAPYPPDGEESWL